jgi:DNA-binding CsgD family transcriptional regulator
LIVSGVLFGTLNFARAARAPEFSNTDLVSARLVSEQLGLATERALRFEMTGHRSSALEHALDRIPQAVIVTDLDARPIFQNRAARNGPGLTVETAPACAGRGVGGVIEEAMAEFRADGKRVVTRSIREDGTDRQAIVKSFRLSEKDQTAVTLVFHCAQDSSTRRLPAWDVLTRREQEIAQLVSEGLTTKQIAAKAFISENTVKQHLKRVFAKTDVSNRAELVQLIWTSGQTRE